MDSRDHTDVDQAVSADPLRRRKAAAEIRLEDVLASIEEARRLIDRAGAALCRVRGMAKESKQLGALYDKVKSTWCAVNNHARRLRTRGRLVLDCDPDACELRQAGDRQ